MQDGGCLCPENGHGGESDIVGKNLHKFKMADDYDLETDMAIIFEPFELQHSNLIYNEVYQSVGK